MITNAKKIIIGVIIVLVFIGGVFFAGYAVANRQNTGTNNEYIARLELVENLNSELQNTNKQLEASNSSLTKRLDRIQGRIDSAKSIVDGLGEQANTDTDTIQRVITNFELLERAIAILLENEQD